MAKQRIVYDTPAGVIDGPIIETAETPEAFNERNNAAFGSGVASTGTGAATNGEADKTANSQQPPSLPERRKARKLVALGTKLAAMAAIEAILLGLETKDRYPVVRFFWDEYYGNDAADPLRDASERG